MSTVAQLVSSLPPVPAYQAAHLLLSAPGALRPAGFGRLGASIHALQAGPAGDGSQKPDGGAASFPAARAGRETPQEGANRDASAGQSHGADGSASPNGRGGDAAPACGAAPVFHTPTPGPQQVLKAEPATADATDRGTPASASPDGGPMGVGQPAAAGPTGGLRVALWNDGTLQVQTPRGDDLVVFTRDEVRQLVEYLSDPAMALREQGASA